MESGLKTMKKIILILGICLPILWSCEDDGFIGGVPISGYLMGKWKLTKIVSPKSVKIDNQIGYNEMLEIGNDKSFDFEKTYVDDKLLKTYTRDRSRSADMSAKNMTILMRYSNDTERFYRIDLSVKEKPSLEATAYLKQVGSVQDTLTYYYSLVR
jgi:hypothetical protein